MKTHKLPDAKGHYGKFGGKYVIETANVIPVSSGTRTLKDATSEAIRNWITTVESTHYIIGSVVGPHPYPMIVRDFQKIIGEE